MSVNRTRFAERLFALLLSAFPRGFRRQFGRDMMELFADQLHDARARRGRRGVLALWLRTVPGLARAAMLEHRDRLRRALSARTFVHHRTTRGDSMLESLTADLRFATRMLRKSPVFTVVAIVCIALGSGAVATIYSAMNALVLRPLPGATDAGRLVRMERKRPGGNDGVSASFPLYELIRERTHTLSGVAAWGKAALTLRLGSDEGIAVYGNFVTGSFFGVLGVHPALGRFFGPEVDRAELSSPVIVVSEGFWRAHLAADPNALGRTIAVNGHPYTLIGVAPAEFSGVDAPIRTDAWLPLSMQAQLRPNAGALSDPNVTWLRLCGRLRPGVSVGAAHRELAALTAEYQRETAEPSVYGKYTDMQLSTLTGLPPDATRPLAMFLTLLLGAAALVLLIASVNVASMLSARALGRRREMAVRAALGASRWRLVRQLLTEILLLFLFGALGGTALAALATAAFEQLPIPSSLPFALELSPDWRVLAFALSVSLATGVIFGLRPALHAAGRDIAGRMRDGSAAAGTRRTIGTHVLVVGQLALALVLLVSAGLFLRALDRGSHIDPGFDASGVETVALDTQQWGYDEARGRMFYKTLRDEVARVPGVTAVSFATLLPLTLQSQQTNIAVDGGDGADPGSGVFVSFAKVDAGYFAALRLPLFAGRPITRSDDDRAPRVAVVNETFARRYWPDGSALGRSIGFRGERATIVGIVRDAKYSTVDETTPAFVYFPIAQHWESRQTLIVRTIANPATLGQAIDRAVHEIDPGLPRTDPMTLRHAMGFVLIPQRVAAIVTGVLGTTGLLLAIVGLYGVVSYLVSRRSREIGIRLAIGARQGDVLRMIVREGLRLTTVGVLVGLVLAGASTRVLARYLFGLSPLDGLTFAAMSLLFVAVALLASYLPARRAATTNPIVVLRGE